MLFTDDPERVIVDVEYIVTGQFRACVHGCTRLSAEHFALLDGLQLLRTTVDEHGRDVDLVEVPMVGEEVDVDKGALEVLVLLDKGLKQVLELLRARTSPPVRLSPVCDVEAIVGAPNHVPVDVSGDSLPGSSIETLYIKNHNERD